MNPPKLRELQKMLECVENTSIEVNIDDTKMTNDIEVSGILMNSSPFNCGIQMHSLIPEWERFKEEFTVSEIDDIISDSLEIYILNKYGIEVEQFDWKYITRK